MGDAERVGDPEAMREPVALGAVVLAGGQSRRMGSDKAWGDFEGRPLLEHVVEGVSGFAWPIVVVARRTQRLPELPVEVLVRHDELEGQGPLVALLVGLRAIRDERSWVYATATDLPFPSEAVARRLARIASVRGAAAAIPVRDGYPQPLAAVLHTRVTRRVAELVEQGERRLGAVARMPDVALVSEAELLADDEVRKADPELHALGDVDTPEELERARQRLTARNHRAGTPGTR
jgi:molybdopterin-guanine dinucleotide biosynthesis protein A